ncbi:hypothetical protein [Shewanella algae]|uniref:hypothetical protein n=1 Tax=Shewanella algae TaxID=38313 RepID=UPI00046E6022|nr:hypothetical protein [Shewanella algae]MBO2636750.1 hypothetical protein [Shewanella algae]HDS1209906.1 hypothetical protein [Shewanella algae]
MAHWNKYSSQRAELVFGRWTWLIGLPLAALTLAQVYFGLNPELLLGWAMGATLGWHALFCRHKILIDKDTGVLVHSIRSIYPIGQLKVPLAEISGFCLCPHFGEPRYWDLILMLKDGQRVTLLRRKGKAAMQELGKELADVSGLAYDEEFRD